VVYIERVPPPKDYVEKERVKMTDIDVLTIAVTHWITRRSMFYSGVEYVGLEGMSYASAGMGNDIAEFHGVLKSRLNHELLRSPESLTVIPPMTLKKFATGKGNADKDMMIEHFIQNHFDHPLHEMILKHPEKFQNKNGKWMKPLDDIVDAVHITRYLSHMLG
jgi:hypothetical protein